MGRLAEQHDARRPDTLHQRAEIDRLDRIETVRRRRRDCGLAFRRPGQPAAAPVARARCFRLLRSPTLPLRSAERSVRRQCPRCDIRPSKPGRPVPIPGCADRRRPESPAARRSSTAPSATPEPAGRRRPRRWHRRAHARASLACRRHAGRAHYRSQVRKVSQSPFPRAGRGVRPCTRRPRSPTAPRRRSRSRRRSRALSRRP